MPAISHLESMYGIFSSEAEFKQHLDRISNSSSYDLNYDKYRTTLAAVPYFSPEPADTENSCPGLSDSHRIFLINSLSVSSLPTLNQQTYEAPPTIQPPTAQPDTLSSSSLQLQNVLAVAAVIIIVCAAIYKNFKSTPRSNFDIKDNDFLARKESSLSEAIPADHSSDNVASEHSGKLPIEGSSDHPNGGQSLRIDPASSPREKSSAVIADLSEARQLLPTEARQLLPISPVPPSSSNLDSPVVHRRKSQNVQKDHHSEQTQLLSAELKNTSTDIFKRIKKLTRALQNMNLDTPDQIQARIDTVGTLKAAVEQIFALNPDQHSFDSSFSFISSNSLINKFYTSGEGIKKIKDIDARMQESFNWFCGILDQLPQLLFVCHTQQIKTPPNPYAVKKVRQDYEILIKSMYNFMDEYIGYLQNLKTALGQQNATQDPESAQDLNAPPLALPHARFPSTHSSQFRQLTSKSH